MARNGSGTYTVPNTFIAGNTITAAGHNQNFSDIGTELTNSVSADGQTAMTGPLKAPNGTVAAPALTFASDLDSGLYRIGANNIGLALNGAKVADYGTAGVAITGTFAASSDFAVATNKFTVAASTGNTLVAGTLAVTGVTTHTGVILGPDGTKTAPGHSFSADPDTGIYRIGTNNLGVSAGDTKIIDVSTTGVAVTGTGSFSSTLTASAGFAVSSGTVTVPAGSIAAAALTTHATLGALTTAGSGTSIDFTGIPANAKIIYITFDGVSTNGTSNVQVQIGDSGGIETSGYSGGFASNAAGNFSAGFVIDGSAAASIRRGIVTLVLMDAATNLWAMTGLIARSDTTQMATSAGSKSTSATLDRVRITTANGTDAFDGGPINICYL